MPQWSPLRPKRDGRCRYTRRYAECLRANFPDLVDRRGIVRLLDANGNAQVRWDESPGELYETRLTNLVREDHEGPDPLDETVVHVTEMKVYGLDDELYGLGNELGDG